MSDTRSDRAADGFVETQRLTRTGIRYAALILVAFCLIVWIRSRPWTHSFQAAAPLDRVNELIVHAGLQPTGYFHEPATGQTGIELARKGCLQPIAILPAMIGAMELGPDELTYRDGDYDLAYAFDGDLYPQRWISYRLEIISTWRRLIALVRGLDPARLHYYMKIWTPAGCPALTPEEITHLRDAD